MYSTIIPKCLDNRMSDTGREKPLDQAEDISCPAGIHRRELSQEVDALSSFFIGIKIEDIEIAIKNEQLVASDSYGNCWTENEIYEFALNECLTFGADGKVIDGYDVNQENLDLVLYYAARRKVAIERLPL